MGRWRQLARDETAYLLLLLVVAGIAAFRLAQPKLIASADGELQLYRAFLLDRALQNGAIFPRVMPDLLFGYGYPLFNFYPPAASYFAVALHRLGLGYISALNAAYASAFFIGAFGMYLLVRSEGRTTIAAARRSAATVAAVIFATAPYFVINVYVRGALGEALALALLPIACYTARRTTMAAGWRETGILAVIFALLIALHSATAAFLIAVALGYGLCCQSGSVRSRSLRLATGLCFGLALAAFLWLPAWLDRGEVAIRNLQSGFYDVHNNFLNLAKVFAAPSIGHAPEGLPIPPSLSLLQLAILLAGCLLLLNKHSRRMSGFWMAVATITVFMMLPASTGVWEQAPLIASLSFPWRLMGLTCFALAVLAAMLMQSFVPRRLMVSVALVAVVVSAILGVTGFNVGERNVTEEDIDIANYWRFEFESGMVGTTSANEYLPQSLQAGSYNLAKVPEDAYAATPAPSLASTVELLGYRAQHLRLRVSGSEPISLLLHAVWFPGWQATVDGRATAAKLTAPLGLVTIDVPAGAHEVAVDYTESPASRAGTLLSVLAAAIGLGILCWSWRKRWRRPVLGALTALLAIGVFWLLSPAKTQGIARVAQGEARLSEDVELLAWQTPVVQSKGVALTLFWLARRTPQSNEVVALDLRDDAGSVVAQWEAQPSFGYSPSARWLAGEIVPDEHLLPLPPGLQPGKYDLTVGLRGHAIFVPLGKLPVPAALPLVVPEKLPAALFQTRSGLQLLGMRFDKDQRAGGNLAVDLRWRAGAVQNRDYTIFLQLWNDRGERVAGQDAQPLDGRRPTLLWAKDEIVDDRHVFSIPSTLRAGKYSLVVGLYLRPEMRREQLLGPAGEALGDRFAAGEVETR